MSQLCWHDPYVFYGKQSKFQKNFDINFINILPINT